MDKSYLSLLGKDIPLIYGQHLSDKELRLVAESNKELANVVEVWGRKAEKDFGYPYDMFKIYGDIYNSQIDHYLAIKNMIPTEDSLKLLNKLATQWSVQEGDWELIYDPLIDDYNMTKEQADEFMDQVEDTADEKFINTDSLQIINKFGYDNYRIGIDHKKFSYKTIVKSKRDINYQDVLSAVNQVVPDFVDYFSITDYQYGGFNKNGLVIIKVDINF